MFENLGDFVIIVVGVGLVSLLLVGGLAALVLIARRRITKRKAEKRLVDNIFSSVLMIVVAIVFFQLHVHFSMKSRLAPLAAQFAENAYMKDSYVYVEDDTAILSERDSILKESGCIGIGKWWAAWGYDRPDIETGMIYLYIPFL